jgi:protein TonB
MTALEYLTEHRAPAYAGIFAIMLASILAYILLHPKMTTPVQKPVAQNQPPKAAPPKPASSAPALGTSLKSNGTSNAFDLSGSGSADGCLGCNGTGDGGGSSYDGYIESQIQQALLKNPVTRYANVGLQILVWIDSTGVITQVQVQKSSGDPAVDSAIQNKALAGMHLPPPPATEPMPILMSLTGEQSMQ